MEDLRPQLEASQEEMLAAMQPSQKELEQMRRDIEKSMKLKQKDIEKDGARDAKVGAHSEADGEDDSRHREVGADPGSSSIRCGMTSRSR